MSLDVYLEVVQPVVVFSSNITHNLGKMADAAGIYRALWRPEELGITKAGDLIPLLTKGLSKLKAAPDFYKQFDSPNGWGLYKNFVPFVEEYLQSCKRGSTPLGRAST